jgi:hypothetical protein
MTAADRLAVARAALDAAEADYFGAAPEDAAAAYDALNAAAKVERDAFAAYLDAADDAASTMAHCHNCDEVFPAKDLNFDEHSSEDICDSCLATIQDRDGRS